MSESGLPNNQEALSQLEDQLRQYLSRPPFWMRFPSAIDLRYENQNREYRLKRYLRVGWISLLFFNLLAIADLCFQPQTWLATWLIRFFAVTCPVAIILFCLKKAWMALWINHALALVQLIVASGLLVVSALASHKHPEYLHFQWLLLILVGNLLTRPRFRVAVPTSALVFVVYVFSVTLFLERELLPSVFSIIQFGLATLISLVAMRRMELDSRVTFALKTQQKITNHGLSRANRKLAEQASRDGLTGIYNRRTLDDNLERFWRHAIRRKRPISVVFVDADYFKRYNDTYGHAAGDECLRWMASILESFAHRPLDFVARFGGEEFVMVLPDTPPEAAGIIAEQIREKIVTAERPHMASDEGYMTASIGVAGCIPKEGQDVQALLEAADKALYQAKMQGRNRVRYADGFEQ